MFCNNMLNSLIYRVLADTVTFGTYFENIRYTFKTSFF